MKLKSAKMTMEDLKSMYREQSIFLTSTFWSFLDGNQPLTLAHLFKLLKH